MAFMGGMGMRQFLSAHAGAIGFGGALFFAILASPGRWADYFMLYGPFVKDTLACNPYRQYRQAAARNNGFELLEEVVYDRDSPASSSVIDYSRYVDTTASCDSDSSEIDYDDYVETATPRGGV